MKLSLDLIPEYFHHCKKFSVPIRCDRLFLTPSPWQLLIYICLWICLFWTFHLNGVIWYVAFFVCSPTAPKDMSSKYILVACIGTVFFRGRILSLCWYNVFFCLSIWLWILYCFCFLHIMNTTAMNTLYTSFHFSYVLWASYDFSS